MELTAQVNDRERREQERAVRNILFAFLVFDMILAPCPCVLWSILYFKILLATALSTMGF